MPHPIRRSAVTWKPILRSSGYSTMLLNGISSITSSGLSACICAASLMSQLGHQAEACGIAISRPWMIQVEAFWSNSDQNGVTRANTIRIRSTARTPSTAASGWTPRARSSCIEAPHPPRAITTPRARQAEITKPKPGHHAGAAASSDNAHSPSRATARATPAMATQ